ncbi:MAG: ABC transporter permease [Kofleriaceae bacterium]|nr:ABC transporter permease [Kofleriaceae bacterium]MBP9166504.1 ABC transporter permease [Kofleriaceae bacterium]MBP9859406.1 ABC transporter permease [Kofleriaceae bacterium]
MPFEWFVALRYLRDARGQTVLILAAVAIGVSVLVFLSALIGGLQASLIDKTLGSQAHVTLRMPREEATALVEPTPTTAIARLREARPQRLRSIDQWPTLVAQLEATAGVIAVSPNVTGAGFAIRADGKSPIVIRGVDPERFRAIIDVPAALVAGRFEVDGDDVTIGAKLAAELGVAVGDKLRLRSSEGVEAVVAVRGIFQLGNEAVDATWVVTSLRQAQTLFGLPAGVTTVELKVGDVFAAERIATRLRERTGLRADSWMTINADLLSGLTAQSSSKTMIQFFVIVAVALGIASVLIVSVVQKSREIGILRAVGTPPRRILLVFLIQGGVLGAAGSVVGSALGAAFAKLFESLATDPTGAPRFPVQLDLELYAMSSAIAIGVGLLAAALPARRAARLDPATAIRNA